MLVKKYLNHTVIFLVIALTGLIAIQLYWINNAITVKEKQFDQQVSQALRRVGMKVEKMYAVNSFNGMRWPSNVFGHNDPFGRLDSAWGGGGSGFQQMIDRNWQIMEEVMQEMMGGAMGKQGRDRINTVLLDSLLGIEFNESGIDQPFSSGYFNSNNMPVLKPLKGEDLDHLVQSNYRVNLFPGMILRDPLFLSVYFPFKKGYVLKNMWIILSISGLLVLGVVASIYITIRTIYQQKKDSEIKGDFISNMTHELKTPISTIALACEAIQDRGVSHSKEKLKEYVGMIQDENKRLGNLVENVLRSAVLEQDNMEFNFEPVNLSSLIDKAVGKHSIMVDKRNAQIHMDLDPNPIVLHGDSFHLTHALSNLLDNAIKYSDETPQIKITTRQTGDQVYCSFEDAGIGIPQDQQGKIFQKLYRVPTGNIHSVKGNGLGLSYVQSVVEKHEGSIEVKSEMGKGSKFELIFPVHNGQG